ncbi:MAG: GerW family sporulation protein [Bacteroidales bacterium]|nr:GerW family sporulation protein [Bacteroidales bacterium]
METNFEQLLDKLSANLKGIATTETVLGEEFTLGEFSCRPVIKVGLGFGGGTGEGDDDRHRFKGKGKGVGAGGGVGVTPVGFLVTKSGEISFISSDNKKGLQTVLEKAPDLIEKVMDLKQKKEGAQGKEEKEEKKPKA